MANAPTLLSAQLRRQRTHMLVLGSMLGLAGIAAIAPVILMNLEWPFYIRSLTAPLAYLAGAFLLTAASLLSAVAMQDVRQPLAKKVTNARDNTNKSRKSSLQLKWLARFLPAKPTVLGWATDSAHIAIGVVAASLAIYAVIQGWKLGTLPPIAEVKDLQIFGGLLLVCAFPLLVFERLYAGGEYDAVIEAPAIDRLLRVSVFALLALGLEALGLSAGLLWLQALGMLTAAVVVVVAAEILLRCGLSLFLPARPRSERKSVVDSTAAGLLRLGIPRFRKFGVAVKNQFGLDLSRSWALSFIQQAVVPLVGGVVIFIWLLTGVTAVGVSERAVYERLGVATEVLHPGLHTHLPWPFGMIRRVEYGVIREIPLIMSDDQASVDASVLSATSSPLATPADGPAPSEDDRLWTTYHPSEATYLIASAQNAQQGFQAVSADLAVVYRFGLSDEAAIQAVYNTAEPQALIRSLASRLLARHFATYTLQDVLGQNRQALAETFRHALQEQLNELDSGIETISVIVEAIHPPAGAASAYHDVHASQIRSQANIAQAQGNAVATLKGAQKEALEALDQAASVAEELIQKAQIERKLFATERSSFEKGRPTFTLERWFEKLTQNLKDSKLLIIDHRLSRQNFPTIDLRSMSSSPIYSSPPIVGDDDH
jgi:regulator of protease activity HflC (stomatin/prohibitin superfamily)